MHEQIFTKNSFCFRGPAVTFLVQNLSITNPMALKFNRHKLNLLRSIFHLDNVSWFITDFSHFDIQNRLLILYSENSEPNFSFHNSLTINLILMNFISRVISLSYLQLSLRPCFQILKFFT